MELLDGGGATLSSTVTNTDGGYVFKGLAAGSYQVRVTPGAGLEPTVDEDGLGSVNLSSLVLGTGEDHLTADFGYNWAPPGDTNSPSGGESGAIGDRIWNDADADGAQDPGEAGVDNVTVRLLTDDNADGTYGDALDNPPTATVTDAAGNYIFDGLVPGRLCGARGHRHLANRFQHRAFG